MNKILLLTMILFGFANAATIPDSLLTPEQNAYVKAEEMKATMTTTQQVTSSWVGVGKEIGEAVNGSMSAITENTNKFANTPVGKYTIFIVSFYVFKNLFASIILSVAITILWFIINVGFLIVKKSIKDYDNDIIVGWQIGIFVISTVIWILTVIIAIGSI